MQIVPLGIVDGIVESPALAAGQGAAYNQLCHGSDVAQFQEIGSGIIIPVILKNLLLNQMNPPQGAIKPLVGANNTDVVPH